MTASTPPSSMLKLIASRMNPALFTRTSSRPNASDGGFDERLPTPTRPRVVAGPWEDAARRGSPPRLVRRLGPPAVGCRRARRHVVDDDGPRLRRLARAGRGAADPQPGSGDDRDLQSSVPMPSPLPVRRRRITLRKLSDGRRSGSKEAGLATEVTVGIDIGTTSVKPSRPTRGTVVGRGPGLPHGVQAGSPEETEHDIARRASRRAEAVTRTVRRTSRRGRPRRSPHGDIRSVRSTPTATGRAGILYGDGGDVGDGATPRCGNPRPRRDCTTSSGLVQAVRPPPGLLARSGRRNHALCGRGRPRQRHRHVKAVAPLRLRRVGTPTSAAADGETL